MRRPRPIGTVSSATTAIPRRRRLWRPPSGPPAAIKIEFWYPLWQFITRGPAAASPAGISRRSRPTLATRRNFESETLRTSTNFRTQFHNVSTRDDVEVDGCPQFPFTRITGPEKIHIACDPAIVLNPMSDQHAALQDKLISIIRYGQSEDETLKSVSHQNNIEDTALAP